MFSMNNESFDQEILIRIGKILGYDLNQTGVCKGIVTVLAAEILAGEKGLKEFFSILNYLNNRINDKNEKYLHDEIISAREAFKNKKKLSKEEMLLLKIPPLIESVNLAFNLYNGINLFNEDIAPQDSLLAISLLRPYLSEKEGHEAALSQYNCLHNLQTLEDFLDLFEKKIDKNYIVSPIIVSANNHSILIYRTEKAKWSALDPNDLTGKIFNSSTELSRYTFNVLNTEYENIRNETYFYIGMDVLCDKNNFPTVNKIIAQHKMSSSDRHMNILSCISDNDSAKNKEILFRAISQFDNEMTDFICSRPEQFYKTIYYVSKSGKSVLYAATAVGNMYALKKTLELLKKDHPKHYIQFIKDKLINCAIQNGQTMILSFLYREICKGEEKAQEEQSMACLACAVTHQSNRMISFILDTMNVPHDTGFLMSVLKKAISGKKDDFVKILYQRFNYDFSNKNIIHYAARSGNFTVIPFLLEVGEDINSIDASGSTALHVAAEMGSEMCVLTLILNNAKLDVLDSDKLLPIEVAILSNRVYICIILAAHGSPLPFKQGPMIENFRQLRQTALKLGISLDLPMPASPEYDSSYIRIKKCYQMVSDKFDEHNVVLFLNKNFAEDHHETDKTFFSSPIKKI